MKTVIFTFADAPDERTQNTRKLKDQLNAEIFNGGTDTVKNLADLCRAYEDDLLVLEDDVEPCNNFKTFTDTIIQKYPETVINFHFNTFPKGNLKETLGIEGKDLKIYEVQGSKYIWNQCFYLPSKIRKLIADGERNFRGTYPYYIRTKQQDVFIAYCIRDLTFMAVYPSLVNHLDFGSTIRHSGSRETIFKAD